MFSTFIYIFLTWFLLGFITAWLFGYPWRMVVQAGLGGLVAGLTLLASILTLSPRMRETFWQDLREDEAGMFWWGVYFWLPLVLLIVVVVTWLVSVVIVFLGQLLG